LVASSLEKRGGAQIQEESDSGRSQTFRTSGGKAAPALLFHGKTGQVFPGLGFVENFIKRLGSSSGDVGFGSRDQVIQAPGFYVSFDLTIPRIIEINLCQPLNEQALVCFGQVFYSVDDLRNRSHA